MPTILEFAEHGQGLGDATAVLRNNAAAAGLDAPVPSCPGWTVRALVTHQGLVHRWAAARLRGVEPRGEAEVEAEAAAVTDLLEWLDDGLVELLNTLVATPAEADLGFFLPDAPAPRAAWARRQCHETTIHAVDAMTARLGRPPEPRELWFGPALAADGIDELLLGFAPRARYNPTSAAVVQVEVAPDDIQRRWTVSVGPDGTRGRTGTADHPTVRLTGSARGLYTGLWHRGRHWLVDGDPAVVEDFLAQLRVRW